MQTTQPDTPLTPTSQLTLLGNCGYRIQDNRVSIEIAQIANQRNAGDLSGTLAVELWALQQPYQGGGFTGTALAGTCIGELPGQQVLADCRYDLIFQEPPAGSWYLSLMLREWTAAGYVTRDHVNFALPYTVSTKPAVSRSDTDNVINLSFSGSEKPVEAKVQTPPSAAAETSAAATATAVLKPAAASLQPTKPATKQAKKDKPLRHPIVSLNKASRKEIATIKGISRKLAENIVSARPYKSLDELLKVKGMGPKLLRKVREFIKL